VTTTRIYRADAYRTLFDATVVEVLEIEGQPAARLDATAFYPTSGGQPHDLGTLMRNAPHFDGVAVVDVVEQEDDILHLLAAPIAPGPVHGEVDWARRFDHMQQHTGQHILSQAFVRVLGAETVSFHLGSEASSIDLTVAALDRDAVTRVEEEANAVVLADMSVTVREYDREALLDVALRRVPEVEGPVRVVHIGDYDVCACGGTHVRAAGEVGVIHVSRWERRHDQVRVEFLCGWRALRDYRLQGAILQDVVAPLSVGVTDLPDAIARLVDSNAETRRQVQALRQRLLGLELTRLEEEGERIGAWRLIAAVLDGLDAPAMRYLAQHLVETPGTVVLLAVSDPSPQLCFARSQDVALDASRLLRESAGEFGGRGGGQPHMAQGGGVPGESLADVLASAGGRVRAAA
jgi:alanyl-tRNA synthetase